MTTMREKAIEAAANSVAEPIFRAFDGYRHDDPFTWPRSVDAEDQAIVRDIARAALDAILDVLSEPDETMLWAVGYRRAPASDGSTYTIDARPPGQVWGLMLSTLTKEKDCG